MPGETESVDAVPQFGFKKRSKPKGNFRKKPATPPPASDSGSDFSSDEDNDGRRIKRRRPNVAVTASSAANTTRKAPAVPESSGPLPLTSSNDATKQSNWYDEEDLSAKNLLGSTRNKPQGSTSGPDGTYKGAANYTSFIQKNPDAPKKFGPVKASTNVRTVTTMDFAPDVCKDWKQTGFCGFGDSCKFLHSREVYAQGWQLDKEWEDVTKGKKPGGKMVAQRGGLKKTEDEEDEDEDALDNIPFACLICRKPYQTPIVTKCGHYFCESCALKRYRKDPSYKKRERARKKREKAIEEGEEVSEEEEAE
ncbi:Pre-mRNA-splicing factor cwc24 [Penicillium chermesinum]|uniref:Pre-mRNA-splicing factor CWC24 n=1 Tax=Penicillium chermesinum TaxID=63820 RepID=A0A9W9TI16_9EURO|nr:Pre-mRNA-splicing factor cwc24 [Penicillium chermesinum]KAJ5223458.1 Pre-mRNA-splicing factor cwc24 [Penicillium chermesinum]